MSDLEYLARHLLKKGLPDDIVLKRLAEKTIDADMPEAILQEVKTTSYSRDDLSDDILEHVCMTDNTEVSAAHSGLGCRGTGDFLIHHNIASLIGDTSAVVDPLQQDDGGVISIDEKPARYVTLSVDGMHSRLSPFPFLAGFHAARAALRDVIVMGAEPVGMFSDIHLANDGDVAKVFDYTAGICAVGELCDVPLVSGSTLRIGGDMLLGDRLTGSVGAVGISNDLTPRSNTKIGDVLIMTDGAGGGTIATTALYNGHPDIIKRTLNVDFILIGKQLLKDRKFLDSVHSMTDVTNGGIRGDALEISTSVGLAVVLDRARILNLLDPPVLEMLNGLDIDPLGVSIDSLLITCEEAIADEVLTKLKERGCRADRIGWVEEGSGVHLMVDGTRTPLDPRFREAPYTPVKRIVDTIKYNKDIQRSLSSLIEQAALNSAKKRDLVIQWIRDRNGV